jgi:beta-N-acetylhexosaminidase
MKLRGDSGEKDFTPTIAGGRKRGGPHKEKNTLKTWELLELEKKIGMLFMAGMPGPELDAGTERLIREHHLGGVILFSRNIENPLQLAELCRDLQEQGRTHQGHPPLLALDQEGGVVARLKSPFTLFPGNEAIGRDVDPVAEAVRFASVTAREMGLVGLNMDLAPVVDVRRGDPERHLSGRIFSDDPEMVALLGGTVIKTLQTGGIMAVAKHFPGLGRAALDPHKRLPIIDLPLEEMQRVDLTPFVAAMEADVSAVMSSHAIYPCLEPDRPATLSSRILTELLRGGLGYGGLTITDDLEMGAITGKWTVPEGAAAAFEAGADILLICKDQEMVLAGMAALKKRLVEGKIPIERLIRSADRVAKAKSRFRKKGPVSLEAVKIYFREKATS